MLIGRTNLAIALQSFFIIGSSSFKAPEFHSSDKNYKLGDIFVKTSSFQVLIPCSHINLNPSPNPNPNQRFICHVLTLMD